jgi:DNA-binding IclR family transcriptional regulator
MDVLRLFSPERTELGVTEVAQLLGKPKSTTSRWLSSMTSVGFLDRDQDSGRYRLSMVLAALGEIARRSTTLQHSARPVLEELTRLTGETTNLVVRDGEAAVNVEGVQSPRPIQHMGVLGRRLPLHATAAGKALLAWRGEGSGKGAIPRPLPAFTAGTITDPVLLEEALDEVRSRGWAMAWKELDPELAAVAAPVRDHRGWVVAAVALSIPTSRCDRHRLEELGTAVAQATGTLSAALGWQSTDPPEPLLAPPESPG